MLESTHFCVSYFYHNILMQCKYNSISTLAQPYLVHKEFYHFNGSLVPPGPVLAAYTCYTTGSPPTTVSWIRNNAPLIIDDIRYSTMQIVINRSNSSYKNVLLVYNLTDILGDPVFRCSVHNAGGSTFGDIREGLTGKRRHGSLILSAS